MIDMDKETFGFDEETIENLQYIAAVSGLSFSQIAEALERSCAALSEALSESVKSIASVFGDIEEMVDVPDVPDDIATLKKQIKYCKNSMEMKMLNKRLNEAYKKNNRRRKCNEKNK